MKHKEGCLTQWQAEHAFQVDPAPPPTAEINDYVISALKTGDMEYFGYFLHAYEPQLNKRVRSFLLDEGFFRYDPEKFLDYKLTCVQEMLEILEKYDPDKGAALLTYAHHFVENAMLRQRMGEEAGSFSSLDEYIEVRHLAWLYKWHNEKAKETIQAYTALANCSEKRAEELLNVARTDRNIVTPQMQFLTEQIVFPIIHGKAAPEYRTAYYECGIWAIIRLWLNSGCMQTVEEITDIFLCTFREKL